MNRYTKVFLALSLFLNLLLLGITFGYTGKCMHWTTPHHPVTVSEITSVLSPEKQKNLQPFIEKSEQEIKLQRDQLTIERRKAFDLVAATPFKKDAYLAQVKAAEDVHAKIVERMSAIVVQIAQQSSDAERASMAQMLVERQNILSSGK